MTLTRTNVAKEAKGRNAKCLLPIGLEYCQPFSAIVTNGYHGHIQFYSVEKDKHLIYVRAR